METVETVSSVVMLPVQRPPLGDVLWMTGPIRHQYMNVLSCSHPYLVAGGVASSWSEDGMPNLGAPF